MVELHTCLLVIDQVNDPMSLKEEQKSIMADSGSMIAINIATLTYTVPALVLWGSWLI